MQSDHTYRVFFLKGKCALGFWRVYYPPGFRLHLPESPDVCLGHNMRCHNGYSL